MTPKADRGARSPLESKSLSVSEGTVSLPQVVEMVGSRKLRGGRGRIGQDDLRHVGHSLQFASVMEVRGPAAGPGGDEGPHSGRLARERRIGFKPGHEQGRAGQTPAQNRPAPIQTRLLEFPGLSIGA